LVNCPDLAGSQRDGAVRPGDAQTRYRYPIPGVFKALRAGLNGEPDVTEGDRFTAAGKLITCSHCAHDRFAE
jgi:hypothetical protein